MAKIQGVYRDKKTGKWYFSASLGFDSITGKRIQKVKRGFNTQKEAYEAKTKLLQEAQEMGQISNNQMTYLQYMDEIYIPDYESRVESTTFQTRLPILEKLKKSFGKKSFPILHLLKFNVGKTYSLKTILKIMLALFIVCSLIL